MATETLPEGTDSIIAGASEITRDDSNPVSQSADKGAGDYAGANTSEDASDDNDAPFREQTLSDRIQGFKGQAGDRVRDYATQGRDAAADAIGNIVRMIEDAAAQIDDKVGAQYGDYARQGAQSLAGLSDTIKGKDVDDLFDDARRLVANSPGIAVATAATLGFVLARLAKAGIDGASAPTSTKGGNGGGAA